MNNRARWTAEVVVAVAAAIAIGFVVFLSLDPDYYYFYTSKGRANWTFSPGPVVGVCGVIVTESLIWGAALISSRPNFLWLRCVLALIVLVPWGLLTWSFMHKPGYFLIHDLWLWLVILSLAVIAMASGTMHIASVIRQRRAAV